ISKISALLIFSPLKAVQFSNYLQGIIHDGFSICHIFVHGKGNRAVWGQENAFKWFDAEITHLYCA
ncbi:MAG: hypothetical protein V2I41_06135, partial [Pseudomonadales bacterium]|nr:hypothetical protein [Pseudomonadales bacterium]